MTSYGSVAKKRREEKARHPADFCKVLGCLWRTHRNGERISYCQNHGGYQAAEADARRAAQRAETGGSHGSPGPALHPAVDTSPLPAGASPATETSR